MDELRVEFGVKEVFKKKLARSRLTWACHAERMGDEKTDNYRANAQKCRGKEGKEKNGGKVQQIERIGDC